MINALDWNFRLDQETGDSIHCDLFCSISYLAYEHKMYSCGILKRTPNWCDIVWIFRSVTICIRRLISKISTFVHVALKRTENCPIVLLKSKVEPFEICSNWIKVERWNVKRKENFIHAVVEACELI